MLNLSFFVPSHFFAASAKFRFVPLSLFINSAPEEKKYIRLCLDYIW